MRTFTPWKRAQTLQGDVPGCGLQLVLQWVLPKKMAGLCHLCAMVLFKVLVTKRSKCCPFWAMLKLQTNVLP